MYSLVDKRVYVAGHRGMVGSSIVRRLAAENCEILTADRAALDLSDQRAVRDWMALKRPQAVFIEIEKLLFLGSSCIYPKLAPQPIREEALLTGSLEPTNESYAVAKIAGIKLAQAYRRQYGDNFISAMLTNAYGPGDHYDPETSHVLPALLRKAHLAKLGKTKRLEIWGTGEPRREFLHVDDCADACVFLMKNYSDTEPINVGSGTDISVTELARLICRIVGVDPEIAHDRTKPDGAPQKLMSSARIRALGWRPKIELEDGIRSLYAGLAAEAAPSR